MSLFDYDNLNGKCSKYETNHLHMYVDDDIDLENLDNMTLSAYATFVHEYVHYIQHITSSYGIKMSDMHNRLFINCLNHARKHQTIEIPLNPCESDNDINAFVTHFNKIKGDKNCSFNISDIEIDKREIAISKDKKTAVWIGCYDFENEKADEHVFRFGYQCIIEGMAHSIQSLINEDIHHSTIPYHAAELIFNKTIPEKAGDMRLIATVCFCSLLWDNPGVGFFEVLSILSNDTNFDGKKLYQSIIRDYAVLYKGQSMPFYRLVNRFSENLKGSFESLMGSDLEYYNRVIDNCIHDCGECHHRLIDVLYDDDICSREVFKEKILAHYGYPLIDGKNQSILPINNVNGKEVPYKESAILHGVELIIARLLQLGNQKECKRLPQCSVAMYREGAKCEVTEDCLSSQWKKQELCIFTEAMRYYKIKDKIYQEKVESN